MGIDAESTFYLACVNSKKQRDKYYGQQPCVFYEKIACHHKKVLLPCHSDNAENEGERNNGCGKYYTGPLGKERLFPVFEISAFHEPCYYYSETYKVDCESKNSINYKGNEQTEYPFLISHWDFTMFVGVYFSAMALRA